MSSRAMVSKASKGASVRFKPRAAEDLTAALQRRLSMSPDDFARLQNTDGVDEGTHLLSPSPTRRHSWFSSPSRKGSLRDLGANIGSKITQTLGVSDEKKQKKLGTFNGVLLY